jgi:hypothetical protein
VLCVGEGEGLEGLTPVMQQHSCVVSSEGGVKCWGRSGYGQVIRCAAVIPLQRFFAKLLRLYLNVSFFLMVLMFCSLETTQQIREALPLEL